MKEKIHLAVKNTALCQNIPFDILTNRKPRIPLTQIVGYSAEDSIRKHLVTIRVIREKFNGIVKNHFSHLVNASCSSIKRIFLRQQFLFNKTHCTAAEDDHHIAVSKFSVP